MTKKVLSTEEIAQLGQKYAQSGRLEIIKDDNQIHDVYLEDLATFLDVQSSLPVPEIHGWLRWMDLLDSRFVAYEICSRVPWYRFEDSSATNLRV